MLRNRIATTLVPCVSAVLLSLASAPASAQTGTAVSLYNFKGGADGAQPYGGVVQDKAGTLYGETAGAGGVTCTSKVGQPNSGCGTVYSFNPTTGLKVLAAFTGPNGAYGMNTLTLVGSTLYGTTQNGGTSDDGVVFSVHTDGTGYTVLHQFSGPDGRNPTSILRKGPGGALYGIAQQGGAYALGVLFSITPEGIYTVLHSFKGGPNDGRQPQTLLISPTGALVGTTIGGGKNNPLYCSFGCGTIFEYVPSTGAYSIPYLFDGTSALGGDLGSIGPGATVNGNGGGSPYSLSAATGLVEIGSFTYGNVVHTTGPLLSPDGALIGVEGSGELSGGILYSAANNTVTTLYDFGLLGSFGGDPLAQPILLPSGNLIGTFVMGGLCSECGGIWEYTPQKNAE